MSQEYNLIQLGSIYLTFNGLSSGDACRTIVTGLDFAGLAKDVQITNAADGTPYASIGDGAGIGSPIKIQPAVIASSVFNSIKTAYNSAIAANTNIRAIFTGDTGTFDINCLPLGSKPLEFGEFFDGYLYNTALNLVIVSFN